MPTPWASPESSSKSTKVSEVAEMAAFLASDRGSGMTGTVANLTGGLIVD
jgi:enoyl-[acyl-carrier-protein] reductase (NADH)